MATGDTLVIFTALQNEPPASNPATPDLRNNHPCLDFDGSTDEEAVFRAIMPRNYGGGGVTVYVHGRFTSATTGNGYVQAAFELCDGLDIDADSFAAFQGADLDANGTSGISTIAAIAFTDGAQMDSVGVGDEFRLKIRRDADGSAGTDDITTDMEIYAIEIKET